MSDPNHIGAILAAGESSRFGAPKALASFGNVSVLQRIANSLEGGGCGGIFAVVGPPHAQRIRAQLPGFWLQDIPVGAYPSMLTSFLTALGVAQKRGAETLVVALLDQPHICASTVATLIETMNGAAGEMARWAVPRYHGRCGHPFVVQPQRMRVPPLDDKVCTLRDALQLCGTRLEVDVADEGVLHDLDTLADASRLGISPLVSS